MTNFTLLSIVKAFNVAIKPTTMYHLPYLRHLDMLAMLHVNENEMPNI